MKDVKFIKRSFFQRVSGKSITNEPMITDCWTYVNGEIIIDLNNAIELKTLGSALRLEGKNLPIRVLIVRGEDGEFKAYHNKCTHIGGRRLDLVPGTNTVQCCSINKSTFDLNGNKIHGPASKAIKNYPITRDRDNLVISILE